MSNTVAKPTPAAKALADAAREGRALMGGTKAMRAAAKAFLPQFEAESEDGYKARLNSSFLFNGYRKTVRDMTGRVFSKPVEADGLEDLTANVDMQGNDLSVFSRKVFEAALSGCGLTFVMVESPARDEKIIRTEDGSITRAQAQQENLRPYLVHIPVEEVLGWKAANVGGKTILRQFRVMEAVEEDDPADEFATVDVAQVRVLTLEDAGVSTRIYRKASDKAEWALHSESMSPVEEITVTPFYAQQSGFFASEPPLEDLGWKNIEHWQSSSDQRSILHFARVPIIHATGRREDDAPLVISAGAVVTSDEADAKLEWVEHSGAAISSGRDDLKDLEFQMQVLGLQLLVAGTETATGAALDAAKETAPLAMMADSLKDTLEQALKWMSVYAGAEQDVSVTVNTDFGVSMLTPQEVNVMLAAVNTGNMPRSVFVSEMKRRGFIAEDTDVDAYLDGIEEDEPALTGEGLSLNDGT